MLEQPCFFSELLQLNYREAIYGRAQNIRAEHTALGKRVWPVEYKSSLPSPRIRVRGIESGRLSIKLLFYFIQNFNSHGSCLGHVITVIDIPRRWLSPGNFLAMTFFFKAHCNSHGRRGMEAWVDPALNQEVPVHECLIYYHFRRILL